MLNPTVDPEELDQLERTTRPLRPVVRVPSPESRMTSAWSYHPADLASIKQKAGVTISVCLPARNEETTIGRIVETIKVHLQDDISLVDELLVLDDGSTDVTALVADSRRRACAFGGRSSRGLRSRSRQGDALWRSLAASSGDLVVWCDGDIVDFGSQFVYGLIGPLLTDDRIEFVKGAFDRPT